MPGYTDILYKYPSEVKHRAFTVNDLLNWGELISAGFRHRVPIDLVEVYFKSHQPVLFYSSLHLSDQRDNRLMRRLADTVIKTGKSFRFPYYERDAFEDVRYTDVLTLGRSVLVLPVKENNQTIGAIALASRVPDVFRDDIVPLLELQTQYVAAVYRTLFEDGNEYMRSANAGYYFDRLPDPVCVVDTECNILYFNRAFETFYHLNTGSAGKHHQPDFKLLMGADAATFNEHIRQALHYNEYTFHHHFLIAGIEVHYRIRMLRINESEVGIWFYNVKDESKNVTTQEMFSASMIAALPFASWQVNSTSSISYVNERFLEITGFDDSDVLNRSFFELLHPSQYAQYFELLRIALSENKIENQSFTAKIKTKNHAWISLHGAFNATTDGNVWFFGNDTQSHQPVFAIANQPLADNLPIGIAALDELFNCQYLSRGAEIITGYDLTESQVTAFPLLVLNDNAAQQLMDSLASLKVGETLSSVYELTEKSGTKLFVSLTATLVKDDSDKSNYLLVLHDVTVLHDEAERWKELAHTAQDTQHAEEQYLARMSHEIRTAMNGIIGLTNVLMQAGLPGEQQQILNLIKQSTDNLLVIINDILDLSKIKSGKLQVEKIPVSLRELFENIYSITLPKIGQKEIQFTYRVDKSVPDYIEADPVRLNQILLNLLSNAIKFTEKGKVEYSVTVATNDRDVKVLKIDVTDTGIGIESHALESIFESYKQADVSTTRKYGGTGLGLPIVKELVDLMGGHITVTSRPGHGTTFSFTMTLVESEFKPEVIEPVEVVSNVPAGIRVLVVDDNYINRLLVIHLLQSRGFEVVEAASGFEALDLLREEDIDAVLMDISMPDMDGFETTRLVRRSDQAYIRNVPVIAMTAHGFQEQVNNAREAGMNDYVVKPFKPDKLVSVILNQLESSDNVHTKPASAEPVINVSPSRLYDLAFIYDYYDKDETFIKHILELYIKETPHTVNEIEDALQNKNWAQFKALVHKIKTNVLMLGIKGVDEFFKISSAINPQSADSTHVTQLFRQFKENVIQALDQIRSDKLSK